MSDFYSSIFPQSTYRRSDSESQGREVRKVNLELPNLSTETTEVKQEIVAKIESTAKELIMALGIESRVKRADQERLLNKIYKSLGISK